jgi:hypothetical protein
MLIYTPSGICPGVKLSYGRSIFSFLNTDFQQCYKSSFPQHPHQDLLFVFLMKAVLPGVRWNLSFHLYFLYGLRMSNILHVLISLCASLENCLFNSHGHLLIGFFGVYFWAFYIFWTLILYPMNTLQRFFSHSVCFLVILVSVSFVVQKSLNLMQSICQFLLRVLFRKEKVPWVTLMGI